MIVFNLVNDGGGGRMAIVVYNPSGFFKRDTTHVYDDRVKYYCNYLFGSLLNLNSSAKMALS